MFYALLCSLFTNMRQHKKKRKISLIHFYDTHMNTYNITNPKINAKVYFTTRQGRCYSLTLALFSFSHFREHVSFTLYFIILTSWRKILYKYVNGEVRTQTHTNTHSDWNDTSKKWNHCKTLWKQKIHSTKRKITAAIWWWWWCWCRCCIMVFDWPEITYLYYAKINGSIDIYGTCMQSHTHPICLLLNSGTCTLLIMNIVIIIMEHSIHFIRNMIDQYMYTKYIR